MDTPRIRLGGDSTWLEMTHRGGDEWRVSADWSSTLTADFTACLTAREIADFGGRMLSHLHEGPGRPFSAAVTPGRNNPLTLKAQPVGDGYAFFVRLSPNGDDDVCHLQMEIDPIDSAELRGMFGRLHASLTLG
jgi:hypothetical protein